MIRRRLLELLVVPMVLAAAAWLALWATLPDRHASLSIPGLSSPVSVRYDKDGVPWIAAGNDLDAAAALGAVHARARMFQMELMRRAGSGRLSEWVGSATVSLDSTARTLGLRRRVMADYPHLPSHTRAMLDAYARGVNAEIAARGRFISPEFLLLGRPEPWTPIDSLLWGKQMALYLAGNYRGELARMALARRVRPAVIGAVLPATPPPKLPTAALDTAAAWRLAALLPRFPDRFTLPSTASDEWAVDGAHSATGAPLLAGDPHLGFSMPGYWYLARIDVAGRGATPARTWAGATAPGLPFLILGRTAQIAWTFTTAQADTQDLFIETAVDASRYLTPAGAAPFVTHDETIKVRGGADRVLHVRETRHGPVISDIDASGRDGQVLAVAMTALQPNDQAAAGLDALNQAQNVPAAMRAAAMITAPVQNLLIADRRHIGLATTGEVPLRAAGDGMQPQDGAAGTFDWTGFASGARLPHYLDPPSGHLLNGNESTAGPDFPVFMGAEQIGDWRARRIRALLAGLHQATVADFVAMQNDIIDGQAVELLPLLQTAQPATALGRRALGLLSGWNGGMGRTLPQPLIYNAWMQRLRLEMLDHAGVPPSLSGQRMELLDAVLRRHDGTALLCGDDDCASLLAGTLDRAMADVAGRQGADPASWRWGRAHRAVFAHPLLARIPWLGRLFSWRIATSGDDGTLDRAAMGEGPVADYDDLHGAAFRAVYDMANPDSSEFVVTPGQSGNVLSAHATDFMRRWRDGEAVSLGPAPHDIEQTLTLQPAPVSGGH